MLDFYRPGHILGMYICKYWQKICKYLFACCVWESTCEFLDLALFLKTTLRVFLQFFSLQAFWLYRGSLWTDPIRA